MWPPTAYIQVLKPRAQGGQGFLLFIRNSALVSLAATAITLTVCVVAAYAATRLRFRGKGAVNWGLLLVYMVPAIVLAIPLFVLYSALGLRTTVPSRLTALTVVYLTATLPVAIYMLRGYFTTIAVDMEEAAMIDGCSRLQTIWTIVIPLSLPAIAAAGLYVFMIAWNEYLYALLFLLDNPKLLDALPRPQPVGQPGSTAHHAHGRLGHHHAARSGAVHRLRALHDRRADGRRREGVGVNRWLDSVKRTGEA